MPDIVGAGRDEWLDALVARVADARAEATLPPAVAEDAIVRVTDTIACAVAGSSEPVAAAAARYAFETTQGPFVLWGHPGTAGLEAAAFANGVAVRCLDFNDAYYGIEPIHPSDMIPSIWTACMARSGSTDDFLRSVSLGYDVAMGVADVLAPRRCGFDHVNVTMLGAVAGVAHTLTLDPDQVRDAFAIAVSSHVALRETRSGQLGSWKGAAAADAARHALYACLVAARGASGPPRAFVGDNGFLRRVMGLEPLDMRPPVLTARRPRIGQTQIKAYPCGFVGQSAAQAAEVLADRGITVDDVANLRVTLSPVSAELMVGPEKLRPTSRETADHSIPYVIAATLRWGRLDAESFAPERLDDPILRRFLTERLTVTSDVVLGTGDEEDFPVRLSLTMHDGAEVVLEVKHAVGSSHDPMGRERLQSKFRSCLSGSRLRVDADELWEMLWALPTRPCALADVDHLLAAVSDQ